jgi:hypothetical protein
MSSSVNGGLTDMNFASLFCGLIVLCDQML